MLSLTSDRSGVDIRNVLMFNAAAALDPATTNKALYSIASSLDLFSFGLLGLLALAFSRLSPGLGFAKALTLVGLLWVIYVLLLLLKLL